MSDIQENVLPPESEQIDLDEIVRKYDTEARYRKLSGLPAYLVTIIAVSMSLFHLYTSGFGLMQSIIQASVHLAFVLTLVFTLSLLSESRQGRCALV
ncbi:hypothetical protein MASR1M66_16130 [Aminivibrio sp.]